jgi:glycosyltransferase involved in cell wall biosynthesis
MHVLYFHQHFSTPAGSTGTRSYEMALSLIERGHTVTMVCGSHQAAKTGLTGPAKKWLRRGVVAGINIIEIQLPYSNYDSFLRRTLTFLKFGLKSIGVACKTDYDLLFATSTPLTAGIPGIGMKIFKPRRPFVFEVRDLWPELPREMGVITNPLILKLMSILEWLSYHAAAGCVGLAPGIVKGIESRRIPSSRVVMIPNGCDLDLFKPSSEKAVNLPGIKAGDFTAVFSGAHGIANGLDAVLEAAAVLLTRKQGRVKLLFIGDGKLKPHLQKRAGKEGLTNCLFFDPVPKTELAEIISAADLGLMILANFPAFYRGTSPNKFFDYIAAGLPVLNNYPGWLAELINNYDCGLAVKPDDPVAFAEALIYLADHPVRCREMGKNSRRLAVSQFDRKELAGQFVDFIELKYEKSN